MAKKGLSDEVTIKLKSKGCKGVSLRRVRGRAFKGMGAAQANALGKERGGPVEKKFKPISFSLFFFFFGCTSWHVGSFLGSEIKPGSPAVEAWSIIHWTTRDVPVEETERLVSNLGVGVGWGGLLGNNLD